MKQVTNVQMGTLGGTLCSVWGSISLGDLVQTVALAAVGAIVSYAVSMLLKGRNPKK